MKVVLSHPTGNANVRGVLSGLLRANMLSAFHTSVATFERSGLDLLGKLPPLAELHRRRFDIGLKPFTHSWPFKEVGRILSAKAHLNSLLTHEKGYFCIDNVYRYVDSKTATQLNRAKKAGAGAVYAYEDGALKAFGEAKKLGMECLYDLPIGYWRTARRLLQAEAERWPDWASTLTGFLDTDEKLNRKDEELRLADRIFVASSFTASTLHDYPGKRAPVKVIPYGFPPANVRPKDDPYNGKRPLRLLFVGGLSQRKGIADLFFAANAIGRHVELTVVGRKPVNNCAVLNDSLVRYRWIESLPHQQILQLMRANDVLVFPSMFEGFGLVITEAMAQGTPVITTERTAGPDVIENGSDGWIINAGNTLQLQHQIEQLLLKPTDVAGAGALAAQKAALRPWLVYGNEVASAIAAINRV